MSWSSSKELLWTISKAMLDVVTLEWLIGYPLWRELVWRTTWSHQTYLHNLRKIALLIHDCSSWPMADWISFRISLLPLRLDFWLSILSICRVLVVAIANRNWATCALVLCSKWNKGAVGWVRCKSCLSLARREYWMNLESNARGSFPERNWLAIHSGESLVWWTLWPYQTFLHSLRKMALLRHPFCLWPVADRISFRISLLPLWLYLGSSFRYSDFVLR